MVLQYVVDYVYRVNYIYRHKTKISNKASLTSSLQNHLLTSHQDRHHWNNLQIHECNQNNSRQTSYNTNLSSWYFWCNLCVSGMPGRFVVFGHFVNLLWYSNVKYSVDICLQILPKVSANA